MYLKKLELSGFKSFATPTVLEFSSGITAVVGPNGSGKSNVADAIRWILGEQSMKNIRSQTSKDLIFSGSKTRSRLGKANVSLCFDNQSGCLPLDYSEVIVSRTIFRDGSSEHSINKASTRLIDIAEILAKANIGHRGFSVINQGMESEILKYNPRELHELLEDASGVRYLQIKKRRSERRLRITQTNLEKASSILTELIPHLKYLRREATKAERREKLKQKLKKFQEQFFSLRIIDLEKQNRDLSKEREDLDIVISKLKNATSQLSEKLQKEEVAIKEGREKFINAQKELEKILDERVKLSEQLANLRGRIQIERERRPSEKRQQISIDLKQAEKELNYIYSTLKKILEFKNLTEIRNEINKVLSRVEKIVGSQDLPVRHWPEPQAIAGVSDKLINKQKALEELSIKINQKYESQKTDLRTSQNQLDQEKFFELEKNLRRKKDDLSDLNSRAKEAQWLFEQLEKNYEELKQSIIKEGMSYDDIKARRNIEQINEPFEQLEEKISRLKYKIEEIGGVDEITLQEYKETKERYDNLSKKLEDSKKAKQDLENLIKQLTKEIGGQFEKNFQVINDNFNKYLRLLFGGGRGHLKQITSTKPQITDIEEEPAESLEGIQAGPPASTQRGEPQFEDLGGEDQEATSKGIEIKATLPGKKIKNLRMFSGGEKALTSIALLFAIIGSNPPPFLVLDEVDATLDESNSQRFSKLLKEFSKNTQFIIITHNRETMNQADALYGVTMGEDGTSNLLSLKLEK